MATDPVQIRIAGAGVTPETVDARVLAEILGAYCDAVIETAHSDGIYFGDSVPIALTGIAQGSDVLTFHVTRAAHSSATRVSSSIAKGAVSDLPFKAHLALSRLTKVARKHHWELELLPRPVARNRRAVISDAFPIEVPVSNDLKGTTTLYGKCRTLGGAKPRIELQLDNGTSIRVDLTESEAKEISEAGKLYEEVGIEGDAVWDSRTWKLKSFTARRLLDFVPIDPVAAFQDLAKSASGHWNDVDPDRYVRQIRHGIE